MTSARRSRLPHWLMLVALAAFLIMPSGLAVPAMIAGIAATSAVSLARWAARRHPRHAAHDSGVTLGVERTGRQVHLSDEQLSAHCLILGASGAGKSTTLLRVLTDRVQRGCPVVAIDMKGSPAFASELAEAAARAGRPFRLWTPDGPSGWNPLAHGNATELKDKLIATERFTEPHYQRAAERYVQAVLQALQHAHPGRAATLAEVVHLMDPNRMPAVIRQLPGDVSGRLQDYLAGLTPDQLSAIRGLGTRLALITESQAGRYLSPLSASEPSTGISGASPPIDLRDGLAGEEVVLFSLNSSVYGKLGAQLGTLAVQDLVSAAGHRLSEGGGAPAMIGIDEFSALGAEHVVALMARGREAGVTVLLATQELADLDRTAYGLRDQVLGNTAVKIAHRQDVPSSAQTVAEMAGTRPTWEETRQIGGGLLGGHDSRRGTRREVEQFVVHPNEIKRLPTGHAVLITKLPIARTRTVRVSVPERRPEGRGLE